MWTLETLCWDKSDKNGQISHDPLYDVTTIGKVIESMAEALEEGLTGCTSTSSWGESGEFVAVADKTLVWLPKTFKSYSPEPVDTLHSEGNCMQLLAGFLLPWPKSLTRTTQRRKDWLQHKVSEDSVHGQLVTWLWAWDEAERHGGRAVSSWQLGRKGERRRERRKGGRRGEDRPSRVLSPPIPLTRSHLPLVHSALSGLIHVTTSELSWIIHCLKVSGSMLSTCKLWGTFQMQATIVANGIQVNNQLS